MVGHPTKDFVYVMNRQGEMRLGNPYRGEEATISGVDENERLQVLLPSFYNTDSVCINR